MVGFSDSKNNNLYYDPEFLTNYEIGFNSNINLFEPMSPNPYAIYAEIQLFVTVTNFDSARWKRIIARLKDKHWQKVENEVFSGCSWCS